MFQDMPEGAICAKCKKRPATIKWLGHATPVEMNHGASAIWWCDVCATQAQIEYCEEQAARIPGLEAHLKALLESEKK